jgi:hypothetical protein
MDAAALQKHAQLTARDEILMGSLMEDIGEVIDK